MLSERYNPSKEVQLLWPARVNNERVAQNRATGAAYPAALIGAVVLLMFRRRLHIALAEVLAREKVLGHFG